MSKWEVSELGSTKDVAEALYAYVSHMYGQGHEPTSYEIMDELNISFERLGHARVWAGANHPEWLLDASDSYYRIISNEQQLIDRIRHSAVSANGITGNAKKYVDAFSEKYGFVSRSVMIWSTAIEMAEWAFADARRKSKEVEEDVG